MTNRYLNKNLVELEESLKELSNSLRPEGLDQFEELNESTSAIRKQIENMNRDIIRIAGLHQLNNSASIVKTLEPLLKNHSAFKAISQSMQTSLASAIPKSMQIIPKSLVSNMTGIVPKNFSPEVIAKSNNLGKLLHESLMGSSNVKPINYPFENLRIISSELSTIGEIFESIKPKDFNIDISEIEESIPYDEFEISDDPIKFENEIYTKEDIQEIIKTELEELKKNDTDTNIINNININIIQGDKSSIIKSVFIGIIVDIIVGVLLYYFLPTLLCLSYTLMPQIQENIDTLIDNTNTKDQKQVVRTIKKNALKDESNLNLFTNYRFVSADILNVRAKPGRVSKKIGELRFGNTVRVIRKKKGWALVEYISHSSEGDIILQGWVFLRYLQKFNQH